MDAFENKGLAIIDDGADIRGLIHTVRGEQVMLDRDLARLYGVETRRLNENVKRNTARFPEEFCFQLTREEEFALMSQIATSNAGGHGGRRKLPYAFTEQGIAMLSAVLRSDTAVEVSIRVMNAFVAMRRFIASNAAMFERISAVEARQLEFRHETEEKFERVFGLLETREEPSQYIFFDGQVYDALELLAKIVGRAEREVVLVDGYVDLGTLSILAKKREGVAATVWTYPKTRLAVHDVEAFNAQCPTLSVRHTEAFHDRYLILDGTVGYHVGASLKDAGRKCFGISRMQDPAMVEAVLARLGA